MEQKQRGREGFKRKRGMVQRLYRNKPKQSETEVAEIQRLKSLYDKIEPSKIHLLSDFPISKKTRMGLEKRGYREPTEIQRESIGLALRGMDILGAAKTGSGKTLAFLIPVLECLYRERWTLLDGLGALIITPTRELAYQIFEVLCAVGENHDFSTGLIIGGKDLKFERKRMDKCNIVICTPGRLLQHMDENPLFDCTNLRILVLDEADMILNKGFEQTMNAIIANLPPHRQTLLFSATQTKSVENLARLSLKDPVYVSVHEHAKHATPETLTQYYMVCELHEKMNMLWSFIKSNLKRKILVFFASCKQVKFAYEIFCRMRPGMTVLALYGTLHQLRRMAVRDEFCRKEHAVLFATDIASRGLDFPSVDWVVQLDCPEDADTYIHRVGRTARFKNNGEALLVLLPSEVAMMEKIRNKKVLCKKIQVPNHFFNVQRKMEALCARDVALKESAQRALVSYLKSVHLMKDKSVFNVNKLDTEAFARSLGLVVAPRIRFLQKYQKAQQQKKATNEKNKVAEKDAFQSREDSSPSPAKAKNSTSFYQSDDESDDDELFTVKRTIYPESDPEEMQVATEETKKETKPLTKAKVAKKILKKKIKANKKVVFNDEGEPVEETPQSITSERAKELLKQTPASGIDIAMEKEIMKEEDKMDKEFYRKLVKAKHREQRLKLKAERKQQQEDKQKAAKLESSEDEEYNPLIEALPDPDKIYRNEEEGEEKEEDHAESSSDSEDIPRKKPKTANTDLEDLALTLLNK